MGTIKRDLINWKKKMFEKMVVLDSELALQNGVFVDEIDKFIDKVGKKEKRLIKQWEETCEILSNPKIVKGFTNALEDFKQGRFEVLEKDKEGNINLTKGSKWRKK